MKKIWHIVIITLSILLVLLFVTRWIITRSVEETMVDKVEELGFNLKYDDLDFGWFSPKVEFENIQLSLAVSDSLLKFGLKELEIEVDWSDITKGTWTHWSSIRLSDGEVSVSSLDSLSNIFRVSEDVEEKIGIEIEEYDISDVSLTVDNFSAVVGSLRGSLAADCENNEWSCKVIEKPVEFTISDILLDTWIPYHNMKIEKLLFSMKSKNMNCEGVAIVPQKDIEYLDANEPGMVVHTSVEIPEIEFIDMDMEYHGVFRWIAKTVKVKQPAMSMYQNVSKNFPTKKKQLPPAWIDSLETQFLIDTIHITNGRLEYKVRKKDQPDVGRLFMDQWELTCSGYGNDSLRPESFKIESSMNWMEGIDMSVNIVFPYGDPSYPFDLTGHIGKLSFSELNPIFEPVENFYFTDGYTTGIKFSFTGNDKVSNGTLRMAYQDVQIAFTNKPRFIEKLLTWGANSFVLDRAKNGEISEGTIHFERVQNKAVTNFWWKSLESGLIDALRK